jgi:hypothetical protein
METIGKPLHINAETQTVLDGIRTGNEKSPLFGKEGTTAEAETNALVLPMLESSGMKRGDVLQYGWFLREVAKIYRTREGADLVFCIEMTLRKWLGFGLEPNTMQFLVCETWRRLKAKPAGKAGT